MSAAGSTPVRLAIISEGVNAWPLYVAQGRKLFEREGVAVAVTLGPVRAPAKLQLPDPSAVAVPSYSAPSSAASE